jgi:AcrR family transcriptional regulator
LAAAAEAIAERGVNGASFAVIGERAGLSRALPTHHFGSKDALVARVAATAQERVVEATTSRLADGEIDSLAALELIRATVDTYLGLFENPTANERALIVMWGATFPSESPIGGMVEADRRAYDGWAELIERGHRDGSVRPDADPAAHAVILHGMLRGIAALLLTESQYTDMSRVRRSVNEWIEAALTAENRHQRSKRH